MVKWDYSQHKYVCILICKYVYLYEYLCRLLLLTITVKQLAADRSTSVRTFKVESVTIQDSLEFWARTNHRICYSVIYVYVCMLLACLYVGLQFYSPLWWSSFALSLPFQGFDDVWFVKRNTYILSKVGCWVSKSKWVGSCVCQSNQKN